MKKIKLVCIIEDDPIHLFITKKNIELSNLVENIITFKNGKEAYFELEKKKLDGKQLPQIIFLDLNMPVWDGWQFLNEFIKLDTKNKINIYILSSSNNEDDIERAKKYNQVNKYYIKPIKSDEVKEILMTEIDCD